MKTVKFVSKNQLVKFKMPKNKNCMNNKKGANLLREFLLKCANAKQKTTAIKYQAT